jgi:hypothetical protein
MPACGARAGFYRGCMARTAGCHRAHRPGRRSAFQRPCYRRPPAVDQRCHRGGRLERGGAAWSHSPPPLGRPTEHGSSMAPHSLSMNSGSYTCMPVRLSAHTCVAALCRGPRPGHTAARPRLEPATPPSRLHAFDHADRSPRAVWRPTRCAVAVQYWWHLALP